MPELQLAPERGTSRWLVVMIAAAVVLLIAVVVYFVLPKSTASVTITGTQIYAPHATYNTQRAGKGIHVLDQKDSSEDTLYVVLTVAIKGEFRMPVSVDGASASLTLADDSVSEGATVARSDVPRLTQIFPEITPLVQHPLSFDEEVKPGETVERQIVVQFPGQNAEAWAKKKALTLTVNMHNQPPQTVVQH